MDSPPSTASSSRSKRRALLSTAAAVTALAIPSTVAAHGGPSLVASVHTQAASPAVQFLGATHDALGPLEHPVRSQLDGLQGLPSTTLAPLIPKASVPKALRPPAPTTTTTVAPTPPTTVAPAPVAYADPNDPATWDRLAQCEAGGNWAANTGNGYYGGLQFSSSSWHSVGGQGLPHQNSRETQIQMGQRLLARGGWKQWPACTRKLHYR